MRHSPPESLLPQLRQQQPILNSTAPLQHPFIICVPVSLAHNVRRSQLELRRERRRTGPLDVFFVVVEASINATHCFQGVHVADAFRGTGTCELGDWSEATRAGETVWSEG